MCVFFRGGHAPLLRQDAGVGLATPAAVSGACGHPALSGRGTRDRAAGARGRGLSLQAGSHWLARSDGKTSRLEALPQGTGPRGGSLTFGPCRGRVIGCESGFAIAPGNNMKKARTFQSSLDNAATLNGEDGKTSHIHAHESGTARQTGER